MTTPESTSADAFDQYLPGRLIAASNGWKNLLVRIYSEPRVEESVIYPAVAEPRIYGFSLEPPRSKNASSAVPGSRPASKQEIFS